MLKLEKDYKELAERFTALEGKNHMFISDDEENF